MKVLQIISSLKPGGAERLVTDLSIALKCHCEVKVVTLYDSIDEYYAKKIQNENIEVKSLNKKRGFDLKCFIRMFSVIKSAKVDIIHCHLDSLKYVCIPAILFNKRVVYTIHSLADKDAQGGIKKIYDILFRHFKFTPVSICETVKKSAVEYYGDYMKNIAVIFNGINCSEVEQAEKNIEFINDKDLKFLCVASFKDAKNHKMLMKIFSDISINYPNSKLFLAGDGILKDKIKKYVVDFNLLDKVVFLGNRTDIYSLMKVMDVFILSSKYEGFSIAILEAMAAKMKILVSDVGGNGEQISHGKTGMLFKLDNVEDIIKRVELLINDQDIGINAYKSVKEKFDIDKISKEYYKLYETLIM